MRYEHIELDISTATCDQLMRMLDERLEYRHPSMLTPVGEELMNLRNELRARLQRTDVDPHCPKNFPATEGWLDV